MTGINRGEPLSVISIEFEGFSGKLEILSNPLGTRKIRDQNPMDIEKQIKMLQIPTWNHDFFP